MWAWIGRLFGRKKKEEPKDVYLDHFTKRESGLGIVPGKDGSDCFTKPNGQWNEPPKMAEVENKLEKMGERLRTDHPASLANVRHEARRTLDKIAAQEKERRPTAMIFPHRPIVRNAHEESPEAKRFRESQAAVDRTRQGMLNNAKRSSTFNPSPRPYNPSNYNSGDELRRRQDDEPTPFLVTNNYNTPAPAPYYPTETKHGYSTSNHSNYDCAPPHQHSHYDNGSTHSHSCPAADPPSFPDPSPSPSNWD